MLAYLTAHDEFPGSNHEYTVLTCVPPVPPRAAAALDKSLVEAYYADEAERVFKPIRAFLSKQGLDVRYQFKVGHAADTIVGVANKGKFDLVVMGSHGHGVLAKLVMGSVATKVIAHCSVPVLLIR
jgi:nucleotide-binding universal stress UspA family protein